MSTEKNINIEKIMAEIRKTIQYKNYTKLPVNFEDIEVISNGEYDIYKYDQNNLLKHIDKINTEYMIQPYKVIKSRSGILGRIIIFIKKVFRKSIKFYIEPIVEEQNEFNANMVRTINEIRNYIMLNKRTDENIDFKLSELKLDINKSIEKPLLLYNESNIKIREDNIKLKEKIHQLEKEIKLQQEENSYFKQKIKLLTVNNEVLEKELYLIKAK